MLKPIQLLEKQIKEILIVSKPFWNSIGKQQEMLRKNMKNPSRL